MDFSLAKSARIFEPIVQTCWWAVDIADLFVHVFRYIEWFDVTLLVLLYKVLFRKLNLQKDKILICCLCKWNLQLLWLFSFIALS